MLIYHHNPRFETVLHPAAEEYSLQTHPKTLFSACLLPQPMFTTTCRVLRLYCILQMSTAWTALEQASSAYPPDVTALKAAIRQARPFEELKGFVRGTESLLASLERGERQPAASSERHSSAYAEEQPAAPQQPKQITGDASDQDHGPAQPSAAQTGGAEADHDAQKEASANLQQTKHEAEVPSPSEPAQQAESEQPCSVQSTDRPHSAAAEPDDLVTLPSQSEMLHPSSAAHEQERHETEAHVGPSRQAETQDLPQQAQHTQMPREGTQASASHQQLPAAPQLASDSTAAADAAASSTGLQPQASASSEQTTGRPEETSKAAAGSPAEQASAASGQSMAFVPTAVPDSASAVAGNHQEAALLPPSSGEVDESGEPATVDAPDTNAKAVALLKLADMVCHRCGRQGHSRKACPSRVKGSTQCYSCQQLGHIASACPSKASAPAKQTPRKVISVPVLPKTARQAETAALDKPSAPTASSQDSTNPATRAASANNTQPLARPAALNSKTVPLVKTARAVKTLPLAEKQKQAAKELEPVSADASEQQQPASSETEKQPEAAVKDSGVQAHQTEASAAGTSAQQQKGAAPEAAAAAAPAPAPAASPGTGSLQDFLSFLLPAEHPSSHAGPGAVAAKQPQPSRRAARPYQSTARTPVAPYRPPGSVYDPQQATTQQSGGLQNFELVRLSVCQWLVSNAGFARHTLLHVAV